MKRFQSLLSKLQNMKLNRKFMTSYLVVCLLPLLFVSVIIYHQAATSLEGASREFASLYTSEIESSMNEFIHEYDRITKSVFIDNDIIARLGEENQLPMVDRILYKNTMNRLLMRISVLKPEIGNLMLISRAGYVYQFSNSSSIVNEQALLEENWYNLGRNPEDTLFITPLHDRSYYEDKGEGAVFTVGRVLLHSNGTYAGVLLMDLDPSQLLKLSGDFLVARDRYDMRVIISTQAGGIVYHSDLTTGKTNWKEYTSTHDQIEANRNNDDLIVLTGRTETGQLNVRTEIPRDKLLLKIGNMRVTTLIVIACTLVFVVAISYAMSSYITKPIMKLRRSMKQTEAGQYLPIDVQMPSDEIGSLVHSYNKMVVTIRTLIEEVYMAEIKQKHAKFLSLQHQINPHMLYNTLESIRMKAIVKEQDEIADMITILARMFRLSLGKEGHRHSVKHEVEYTTNYMKLQNIRYDHCFKLHIAIAEEALQCAILPLIFQPIVENSINHGFVDYSRTMNISLEGDRSEDGELLRIRIRDDGSGMEPERLEELRQSLAEAETDKRKLNERADSATGSIGLKNIAERIKLHYGDQYGLTIDSRRGGGTLVELLLPYLPEGESEQ
ncbi:sensor histidine kinase [Paenibacillus sp. HB172176]|uniref:cache domain-containing sensor histidine kinase n=1 Tax=Paenibacillus sp. HB172176 TaxID=2493690 RepID=UPI001F0E607A|nr:sensor histidine kinase [Paenibacillus sp. HB172176]